MHRLIFLIPLLLASSIFAQNPNAPPPAAPGAAAPPATPPVAPPKEAPKADGAAGQAPAKEPTAKGPDDDDGPEGENNKGIGGLNDNVEDHTDPDPVSIRAEEPAWRWFVYVGIVIGIINLMAAVFIMTTTVPHLSHKKKKVKGPENEPKADDSTETALTNAIKRMTKYLPIRQGELEYLEHEEDESLPENQPLPVVGRSTINTHLALEEAHRNEHRFAFYTSGTDFLLTLMVLLNLFYSMVQDHTLKPKGLCSAFGFSIFSLINMDLVLVAYEAILCYLAVCAPTENRKKGRYHWRIWLILIIIPWMISAALLQLGSFGSDIFWCFIVPHQKSGKTALAVMCIIHYTVLVVVGLVYLPMVAIKPKSPPGHKPTEVAKARAREAKVTAYHLLVHVLHYTPGTFHAFSGFAGYEPFWVYVFSIVTLQIGAIVHSFVVLWSWSVERKHKKRIKAASDSGSSDSTEAH